MDRKYPSMNWAPVGGTRIAPTLPQTLPQMLTGTQTLDFKVGASLKKRSNSSDHEATEDGALERRDDVASILKPSFSLVRESSLYPPFVAAGHPGKAQADDSMKRGQSYSFSKSKEVSKGLALTRPSNSLKFLRSMDFVRPRLTLALSSSGRAKPSNPDLDSVYRFSGPLVAL